MQSTGRGKGGGINSAPTEGGKASQKIGTVRGVAGRPGWEVLTRSFLPPQPFRLGDSQVMFTDRQWSLSKAREGRGGEKKSTNHKSAHCYSPRFQSARLKKTNKKLFPNCSAPSRKGEIKTKQKQTNKKHHTHKTWGVIAAPNFSPPKSPNSLLFLGSGNCLNAI